MMTMAGSGEEKRGPCVCENGDLAALWLVVDQLSDSSRFGAGEQPGSQEARPTCQPSDGDTVIKPARSRPAGDRSTSRTFRLFRQGRRLRPAVPPHVLDQLPVFAAEPRGCRMQELGLG
jgi:hypothetical protein